MGYFMTEIDKVSNFTIVNLLDKKNHVRAKIIPELGNNLVSLTIGEGKDQIELIHVPTEIENLKNEERQFYGNPILFPFPGRIPEGKFSFEGQEFQLPINFNDGTAIHGFVYDKKWEIREISNSEEGAFLKSAFQSEKEIEKYFPFPFRIEMNYILREFELIMVFRATNLGKTAFPFGYGIHPYFLLTGKREDWALYFPASKIYELINILPTGNMEEIPEIFDFRDEKSLDEIYMDDLFGSIKKLQGGGISCWLRNRVTNFKLTVTSDQNFDYYVLYAPKEHNFICIEPYSCIANAFNLVNSGIETGMRTLAPNEEFKASISFRWEF